MGSMSNDSTTVRKDQAFEMMLAEYRGKVYGYSRSTFIVNDTLYYIVKKVKGTIDGDKCEVKDESIVSCNFQHRIDKGVKVVSTFYRNQADSNWYLAGDWKTNATKKYYSVTGKVRVKEETDYSKSELFPHLEELQLAQSLPNYQQVKQLMLQDVAHTDIQRTKVKTINDNSDVRPAAAVVKTTTVPVSQEVLYLQTKTDTKIEPEKQQALKTAAAAGGIAQVKTSTVAVDREVLYLQPKTDTKVETEKQQGITSTTPGSTIMPSIKTKNTPVVNDIIPATTDEKTSAPVLAEKDPTGAAAEINEREMGAPQIMSFKTDSLVIALYDNGEIDGDTISVIANGQMLLAKQGLKATAIRKTIYIPSGSDEFSLVLYAENLGKYPPNTGLMIVYDGDERHEIRFSADLQRNASVIFRRKQ